MTPTEKAKQLVDKFSNLVTTWDCYNDVPLREDETLEDRKNCALICIDEIILTDPNQEFHDGWTIINRDKDYWQEVKQEINKL